MPATGLLVGVGAANRQAIDRLRGQVCHESRAKSPSRPRFRLHGEPETRDFRNGSNSEVAAIANHVCSTQTTDICALSEHFRFVPQTDLCAARAACLARQSVLSSKMPCEGVCVPYNMLCFWRLLPTSLLALVLMTASQITTWSAEAGNASKCDRSRFRVVVDVGHTVQAPGALSARSVPEYNFNLRLGQQIHQRLIADGFTGTVLLVTEGEARPSLFKRA